MKRDNFGRSRARTAAATSAAAAAAASASRQRDSENDKSERVCERTTKERKQKCVSLQGVSEAEAEAEAAALHRVACRRRRCCCCCCEILCAQLSARDARIFSLPQARQASFSEQFAVARRLGASERAERFRKGFSLARHLHFGTIEISIISNPSFGDFSPKICPLLGPI